MTALALRFDLAATTEALQALGPLAALITAAVFLVAAVTKLVDLDRTASEFAALELPIPAALARVVPAAELGIVGALLVHPPLGAGAAMGALLAFTGVLVGALRHGRTVSCGCLGRLSTRPVTWATVARNGALLGIAALAGSTPAPAGPVPNLPALDLTLAAGSTALLVAIGLQLAATRAQLGRIWSVALAGEETSPIRAGAASSSPNRQETTS